MWTSEHWKDYELLDCSGGEKLERWGNYILRRPDPQAIWQTPMDRRWEQADAIYRRSESGGGRWVKADVPSAWQVSTDGLTFNIKLMNFKHTGIFPEQAANWNYIDSMVRNAGRPVSVLNLFAYTGAASLAAAKAGASVCHVDAAKGMVAWAKENAVSSGLQDKPIRWIVDDCRKFVEREIRRGKQYDAIIADRFDIDKREINHHSYDAFIEYCADMVVYTATPDGTNTTEYRLGEIIEQTDDVKKIVHTRDVQKSRAKKEREKAMAPSRPARKSKGKARKTKSKPRQ